MPVSKDTNSALSIDIETKSLSNDYDVAQNFLRANEKSHSVVQQSHELIRVESQFLLPTKLLRKIDWHILPFLCFVYLVLFLDGAALNYSAVMGIKDNLKGNEFANLGTIYNAAYIFGEPICGYIIQRFPISKGFGVIISVWGVVVACHAACHTYAALMVVRALLGILQSCVAVALICIVGGYYTRAEQAERIGYYCNSAGFGYIFGGLLSFAFQHVHSNILASWQILFLVLGVITFFFGIMVFFWLPDNVTGAWFLDEKEKLLVLEHIRSNQTGVENKKFKGYQIKELFLEDKLTWPMLILTICSQIVTGAVGTFSATITATFGFDNYVSALLQIPIGVIVIICITAATQLISHWSHFTLFHVSMYVPSVVGSILLICLPLDHKLGNLFGLYLLYSGSCAITLLYVWNGANTAGYTKRVFRNTTTMMAFGVANIIGPQLFRASDYPIYMPAKITILVTQAVAIPLCLFVGWLTWKENRSRGVDADEVCNYEFLDHTDIENKNFRYMY